MCTRVTFELCKKQQRTTCSKRKLSTMRCFSASKHKYYCFRFLYVIIFYVSMDLTMKSGIECKQNISIIQTLTAACHVQCIRIDPRGLPRTNQTKSYREYGNLFFPSHFTQTFGLVWFFFSS